MDSNKQFDESSPLAELSDDRQLALHELNSIINDFRQRYSEVYIYTKKAWYRDRVIGWFIIVALTAGLIFALIEQYTSTAELRRSLYEVCLDNNGKDAAKKALYQRLSDHAPNEASSEAYDEAAEALVVRDCRGIYLNRR